MNLLEIRTKWIDTSGRRDLIADTSPTDYDDNGANFFIQAGQRLLDTILPNPKSEGSYIKDLTVNDYKVMIKYLRAVKKVWIKGTGLARYQLIRKTYSWLQEEYGDSIASSTAGQPRYYAPILSNLSPEQKALTSGNYTDEFTRDFEDITFGDDRYSKNGITFRPKTDATHTITITGDFFSNMLVDADISYHSEIYPELLILATNFALEAFYKNTQGMNDWKNAMNIYLRGIDHDMVKEEMEFAGNQMRG
ncbi:hypothetical protein LCGC14_0395140 [marine sediment metagenome]|uniref:Uncharacterized protein n=1 Tax=marine sediment metagenome TaxID=412755 RepID=A0A0F9T432_9ZZZZ